MNADLHCDREHHVHRTMEYKVKKVLARFHSTSVEVCIDLSGYQPPPLSQLCPEKISLAMARFRNLRTRSLQGNNLEHHHPVSHVVCTRDHFLQLRGHMTLLAFTAMSCSTRQTANCSLASVDNRYSVVCSAGTLYLFSWKDMTFDLPSAAERIPRARSVNVLGPGSSKLLNFEKYELSVLPPPNHNTPSSYC
jgi:hypothetical protein